MSVGKRARDAFATRWGFTLACIGSAVGMGNIWMFPQRVSKYGGGTFLIPYFLFVILIAASGVVGEMALGRGTRSGPMGAFRRAVESRGGRGALGELLGAVPVLGSLALAIGYSVVVGWILKYTVGAFTGATLAPEGLAGFGGAFGAIAFESSTVGESISATLAGSGNSLWQVGGLVLCFGILIKGIGHGIERANKVMMPLFFLLFVGLGIYVAFLPGSSAGYRYIFTVEPRGWLDPMTWIFAMGQAFFSLSIAGNGTLIYGSYLSDREDIPRSAKNVAFFDTLAALLAALVIIPAMATTGVKLNSGGPGLMFVHLPNLFKTMPGGPVVVVIFFVAVLFAGMTSLINLYEAPIATLQEKLGIGRTGACLSIAVVSTVVSLGIQGVVAQWMDAVSIYVCPLGAAMAGIMFFWVFGGVYAVGELRKGRKAPLPRWVVPLGTYVYCVLTVVVLILGVVIPGGIG